MEPGNARPEGRPAGRSTHSGRFPAPSKGRGKGRGVFPENAGPERDGFRPVARRRRARAGGVAYPCIYKNNVVVVP